MKTLIIHPDDRSTDFLKPIYQNIKGATVLTKDVSQKHLEKAIRSHDQILMMGHGSPYGLLNYARIGEGLYAIGERHVEMLRSKRCIFIWCNADQFVNKYRLGGLYTGMFISEVGEANYCKVTADQEAVDTSNSRFASLLGGVMAEDLPDYGMIFEYVKKYYGVLAEVNDIASYNNQRWYFKPEVRNEKSSNLCLKIKDTMKKLLVLAVASSFTACSPHVSKVHMGTKGKFFYEVDYYQEIENAGVLESIDFIFLNSKDTSTWKNWYRETPVYKTLAPKSDSIRFNYWGTCKEWKALGQ